MSNYLRQHYKPVMKFLFILKVGNRIETSKPCCWDDNPEEDGSVRQALFSMARVGQGQEHLGHWAVVGRWDLEILTCCCGCCSQASPLNPAQSFYNTEGLSSSRHQPHLSYGKCMTDWLWENLHQGHREKSFRQGCHLTCACCCFQVNLFSLF